MTNDFGRYRSLLCVPLYQLGCKESHLLRSASRPSQNLAPCRTSLQNRFAKTLVRFDIERAKNIANTSDVKLGSIGNWSCANPIAITSRKKRHVVGPFPSLSPYAFTTFQTKRHGRLFARLAFCRKD